MVKPFFSVEEARRVAFETPPATLGLQLHQWTAAGDLVRFKRGVYGFPGEVADKIALVPELYGPAYVSLESALHAYGLLPDVVFSVTLVTPRLTRRFTTPVGEFVFHHIKPTLFWGYDPQTLMGEREKVLVDYFYFNSARLTPARDFWREMRWQNLDQVNFRQARQIAKKFGSKKVTRLLESLAEFGSPNPKGVSPGEGSRSGRKHGRT